MAQRDRDPASSPLRHLTWEKVAIAALLGLGSIDTRSKSDIADQLKAIQHSVQEISTSLAVVLSRMDEHERRIDRLENITK